MLPIWRHCEEPCDEAIPRRLARALDCFAPLAMTSFVVPAMHPHPGCCSRTKPHSTNEVKNKGGEAPKGAYHPSAPSGAARPQAEDARLPALHRGSCPAIYRSETQSRPRFTRWSHEGITFAMSPCSSEAPRAPVIVPAGRCPDRPGAEVTSLRPQEPLPLRQSVSPADVPHDERECHPYRIRIRYVNKKETNYRKLWVRPRVTRTGQSAI